MGWEGGGVWGVCRSFLWTKSKLDRAVLKALYMYHEAVFSAKFESAA